MANSVSAIWLAAPESTISRPITAPNTTMMARDPRVLPKPVCRVVSRLSGVIAFSPAGNPPVPTATISSSPITRAASRSASIALTLYRMLSTSIKAMPMTTMTTCSHSTGVLLVRTSGVLESYTAGGPHGTISPGYAEVRLRSGKLLGVK